MSLDDVSDAWDEFSENDSGLDFESISDKPYDLMERQTSSDKSIRSHSRAHHSAINSPVEDTNEFLSTSSKESQASSYRSSDVHSADPISDGELSARNSRETEASSPREAWPSYSDDESGFRESDDRLPINLPFNAHILPACGRRYSCVVPIIPIADDENINLLLSSALYQRQVLGINQGGPAVGLVISNSGTSLQVIIAWLDPVQAADAASLVRVSKID